MDNRKNREYSKAGTKEVLRLKGMDFETRTLKDETFYVFKMDKNEVMFKEVDPVSRLSTFFTTENKDITDLVLKFLHVAVDDGVRRAYLKNLVLTASHYLDKESEKNTSLTVSGVMLDDLLLDKTTDVRFMGKKQVSYQTPLFYKHFKVQQVTFPKSMVFLTLTSQYVKIELSYDRNDQIWSFSSFNIYKRPSHGFQCVYKDLKRSLSKFKIDNIRCWLDASPDMKSLMKNFVTLDFGEENIFCSGNELREERLLLNSVVNRVVEKVGKDYEHLRIEG